MNRHNSEMSRQGLFKYSVSRKSVKCKPKKFQQSLSESLVTLDVTPNGLQCYIEKTREQFLLTKENICGLETGRIVLPSKKCWGGGRSKYHNYLMVVLHQGQMSEMILLLTQYTGNTDEDQITTNWKWSIQKKLDFVNSWPNIAVDYLESPQKIQSKQVTLMLGKTWLSIFKYCDDSLPSYWKYFSISQVSVDLVRVRQQNGKEAENCVIKIKSSNQAYDERFVIKSSRKGAIYGYIQTYISPPATPPRINFPSLPPPNPKPPSTVPSRNQSVSSSSSETDVKKIYSLGNTTQRPVLQRPQEVQYLKEIYIISQRPNMYFTNPKPDVYLTSQKSTKRPAGSCHLSLPTDNPVTPGDNDLPPPTPCGVTRNYDGLKDHGYLDRPYIDMRKKSYTPSVALLDVSSPIHPSLVGGHRGGSHSALNYIHLLGPAVDNELIYPDTNMLPVRRPSFKRTLSFQHCLSVLYDESNVNSLNLDFGSTSQSETEAEEMHEDDQTDPAIRFEITVADDTDPKTVSLTPVHNPSGSGMKHCQSTSESNALLCPPKPCNINWFRGRKPNFYRSFSLPRTGILQRYPYSTCITDSERHTKQMLRWKNELNLTLPRHLDTLYVKPDYGEYCSMPFEHTSDSYSCSSIFQKSSNDYDLYDLNFLLFPLNNLSVDKKEEVFDWITVYNKGNTENQVDNMARNIYTTEQSLSDNVSYDSQPVKQRHRKPYRRHRKSLSSTAVNETTKNIDDRRESEFYSYWSATNICKTLDKIMTNKLPVPDTLGLSRPIRKELCLRLYTISINSGHYSWETLAGVIGLEEDSVNLIELYIQNHSTKYSAADIVLRHWQFMYNKGKCQEPCTKENLLHILRHQLERHDLVELLQEGLKQSNECRDPKPCGRTKSECMQSIDHGDDTRRNSFSTPVKQKMSDENCAESSDSTQVKDAFNVAVQDTCCTRPVYEHTGETMVSDNMNGKQAPYEAVENTCYTNCVKKTDGECVRDTDDSENSVIKQNGTRDAVSTGHSTPVKQRIKDSNEDVTLIKQRLNEGVENTCNTAKVLRQDGKDYMSPEDTSRSLKQKASDSFGIDGKDRSSMGPKEDQDIKQNEALDKYMDAMEKDPTTDFTINAVSMTSEDVKKKLDQKDVSVDGLKVERKESLGVKGRGICHTEAEELCKKVALSIKRPSMTEGQVPRIPLKQPKPFVVQVRGNSSAIWALQRSDV